MGGWPVAEEYIDWLVAKTSALILPFNWCCW